MVTAMTVTRKIILIFMDFLNEHLHAFLTALILN